MSAVLTSPLLSDSKAKKVNGKLFGEQRNLFPVVSTYFNTHSSDMNSMLNLLNGDLERARSEQRLSFLDLREKTILGLLHKPKAGLEASDVENIVDSIIGDIEKRIKAFEERPISKTKEQKRYEKIAKDLPAPVAEIVKSSFAVLDLSEVAWDLNTSLDKVFAALRFFERKMLHAQNKPIAREIKVADWKALTEQSRDALACEFAGFHRDETAAQQGIGNRTLTNKFLDIRNQTGLAREVFDAIKLRNASRNLDIEPLHEDRLINFVFEKEELEIKAKKAVKPLALAASSLSPKDLFANIKGVLDRLPDKFREPVLAYIEDEEIHTNDLRNRGMTRTLGFARGHLRRHLKALLTEETPQGLNRFQWAMYKSPKRRNALRLYLKGYSRAQIERSMKKKISVESLWSWRQDFMKDFSVTKDSLEKLRFRNKIAKAKSNKAAYRKRAFLEIFPKGTKKPKKKAGEKPGEYYARVLSMISQVTALYPKKETTYQYFKYRILGLTTPQIAKKFNLHKSSIGTSLKNFSASIREKIYDLEKSNPPKSVDAIDWLAIKEEHRQIMEVYLDLKEDGEENLFESLQAIFNDYTIKQLYAITHAARKKLGMKIL